MKEKERIKRALRIWLGVQAGTLADMKVEKYAKWIMRTMRLPEDIEEDEVNSKHIYTMKEYEPLDSEKMEEAVQEDKRKDTLEVMEEMFDQLPQTEAVHHAEKVVEKIYQKWGLRLYK